MSQECQVCHGDISLNNLAIHRVWDDDDMDDLDFMEKDKNDIDLDILAKASNSEETNSQVEDSYNDSDSDSKSESDNDDDNNNSIDSEPWSDGSPAADIDERGPLTTQTVGSSSMSESDLTSLSSSTMSAATIQPPSTVPPSTTASSIIRGYGLVIDFDNSFSIADAKQHGYKITSVRHPILSILLHLILY